MATLTTTIPPTSQKDRMVSFRLDGRAVGYPPVWYHLPIRPEDLAVEYPSRASVHQSLSNQSVMGWVDDFGEGLPVVVISGHTGWRRNPVTGWDGERAFRELHKQVMREWHNYRQQAINVGKDPDLIKLTFIDDLDNIAYLVVPLHFNLRRTRTRALLIQYNIRMQAISLLPEVPKPSPPLQFSPEKGLTSLQATVAHIEGAIANVTASLNSYVSEVAAPVHDFMQLTHTVLSTAQSLESSILAGVGSVSDHLIGVAQDIAQAGRNIFWTINGVANLPDEVKFLLSDVGSSYSNAFCIFGNSLKRRPTYPQYNALYGASNCSSTAGGSPLSQYAETGVSAFPDIFPPPGGLVVTTQASGSLAAIKHSDPVLHPMSTGELAANIINVNKGISGVAA